MFWRPFQTIFGDPKLGQVLESHKLRIVYLIPTICYSIIINVIGLEKFILTQ